MSQMTIAQAVSLGLGHHQAGRLREAEAIYRQILEKDPNHADVLHLLGVLAHQCGHPQAAVDLIQKSLAINAGNSAALTNLGESLRVLERHDQAVAALQKSLAINPSSPEAIGNLGIVYADMGKIDLAVEFYQKSMAINPRQPRVLNNLGNAKLKKGDVNAALTVYDQALALDPAFADGHNNRGSALEQMDRLDEAMRAYVRAVELQPAFTVACNNAGNVARRFCKWDEAMRWFDRALQIDRNHKPAIWNVGLIELTRGDYLHGLPKYELRFAATSQRLPDGITRPRWDGQPLKEKTILLFAEQGLGDGWQAARYVPMLASRGARIVIECHASQVGLMRRLEGVVETVAYGGLRPDHDFYEPMMSLPMRFGTTLQTIPGEIPYIKPDQERIAAWRERLSAYPNLKVGLVWDGSKTPEPLRSIPLDELAPLASLSGVQYISLQFGAAAGEAKKSAAWKKMLDLSDEVADFGETAACMMNLDLVLTVDTAAAHLAGALGRPTWTLLPFSPDWRWLLDREDSPWYPTMRLFRQTKRKVWTNVVERVAMALREMKNSGGPANYTAS